MRVIIHNRVYLAVEEFYRYAIFRHPALDMQTVLNKEARMYQALQSLSRTYFLYDAPRYNKEWQQKGYLDFICEDFHFAYRIVRLSSGEEVVSVEDAVHSLLFHD